MLELFPKLKVVCTEIFIMKAASTCVWVRKLISGLHENDHVVNFFELAC